MLKPSERVLELELIRVFDAPRDLVWRNWTDPEAVADWYAADTWRVTGTTLDVRVGGRWRVDYLSETDGSTYFEHGTYTELTAPSLLGFTMIQTFPGDETPEMQVTVTLRDLGRRTEVHFRQSGFDSPAHRDGMREGWGGVLDKLAARLAKEAGK